MGTKANCNLFWKPSSKSKEWKERIYSQTELSRIAFQFNGLI